MSTDIILVHTGKIFPKYINDNISLLKSLSYNIHLIIEPNHYTNIIDHTINIVDVKEVSDTRYDTYSIKNYDTNFRDNFFSRTSSRFILINNYAIKFNLESFFHIENDVAILQNISHTKDLLDKSPYDTAIVMDSPYRCVPSIMWFKNSFATKRMSNFIYENNFLDDMKNLAKYYYIHNTHITNFPIVPFDLFYGESNTINFGNMYTDILGVFDGAAIGQYLYGTDPSNNLSNSITNIGFVNEACVIDYSNFKFDRMGRKHFLLDSNHNQVSIFNLHMHCKNLEQLL